MGGNDAEAIKRLIADIRELQESELSTRSWAVVGLHLAICQKHCEHFTKRDLCRHLKDCQTPAGFAKFLCTDGACERFQELHRNED